MERKTELSMLGKASLILASFTSRRDSMALSEIAARSGLAVSTTHRLVGELCTIGWLTRTGKSYSLGLGMFELGELVPIKYRLRTVALPFMQDLLQLTNETVHLGIRSGSEVVYIEKLHRHNAQGLPSRTGGRAPLTCTAVGKALLLHEAAEVVDDVLAEPMRTLTSRSCTNPDDLRASLLTAKRTNLTVEIEEASPKSCCIGTPVVIGTRTVAALSISAPISRFNPQMFGPALRTAAMALARRLGMRYQLAVGDIEP